MQQMTTYMANFVSHIAKVLPDDIIAKLDELGAQEDAPLSKVIYETMKRNQKLAKELGGNLELAVKRIAEMRKERKRSNGKA